MINKTWEQYHADITQLVANLGDYRPDIITPCMLGGLVPGAIMAKQLGIQDVRPIDIERIGDSRRLAYDVQGDINSKKLLIVEDDLPTGKGPEVIKKIFENRGADVKIAAIYVSETSQHIADFYAEKCDEFVNYPWKPFHRGDHSRD